MTQNLVTYASAHGSTAGAAERIGQRLRAAGHRVDVRSVAAVDDISRHSAVIIGSAIHNGEWLGPAARFVMRNRESLSDRSVWLFSVSSLGDRHGAFAEPINRRLRAMRKETKQIAAFRIAVAPRDHRNFTGAIERSHWPYFGRMVVRLFGGRFGDHRDWPDIDRWAADIATQL